MTTHAPTAPRIDFKALADRADLQRVIESRLGAPASTRGKPVWHCPFGNHNSAKLYLWASGRRWCISRNSDLPDSPRGRSPSHRACRWHCARR